MSLDGKLPGLGCNFNGIVGKRNSLGQQWNMINCQGFRQAEHDVHVLHGLSRCTLYKIIRYREYHGGIAPLRAMDCDTADIRPSYRAGFRMSTCGKHVYKWLISISFFVQSL